MYDPWFKTTLGLREGATSLTFRVPHDVFATQAIDDGTRLLLDHLPEGQPARILDLGCGYGALGLPVAARYPSADLEMVDRDLLAAEWAGRNARENGLARATAHGSLGYRDVAPDARYDWVLCNVPARIGRPFIANLFEAGVARLAPGGEVRVVVILDLAPVLESLAAERGWPLLRVADGARHAIFALRRPDGADAPAFARPEPEAEALYARDEVAIASLALERPHDLGGDDPRRVREGLPVLLDALPRAAPRRAYFWRIGYGPLPLAARARWPAAHVVAVDRDLLATTFTRINAVRTGLAGEQLEVREAAHFPDAFRPGEKFDFAAGEISPSAGERVAEAELLALAGALAPGGQALVLALEKLERQWLQPMAARRKLRLTRMITRGAYAVLRLAP